MGSAAPPSHARWTTVTTHDTPSPLPPPAAAVAADANTHALNCNLRSPLWVGPVLGHWPQKNYLRKAGRSHSRTDNAPRKRGGLRLHAGSDAHQPSATNTLL